VGPILIPADSAVLIYGFACAMAIIATLLITPLVIRAATAWQLYDVPSDDRRVHSSPVPRLGGVAVFASTLLVLVAVSDLVGGPGVLTWTPALTGFVLAGGLLFAVGVRDDLSPVPALVKLLMQVLAATVVFQYGFQVRVLSFGSSGELDLGILSLPITVLWIVGVTNAFNLIDGLDGLATGIAVVALGTTFGVSLALGNVEVALISATLCGALLGFLRFNFSPARIFLGDSGSLFVGFMLAVLSVHGSMKSATTVMVIVPLLALGVPLLDTSLAIVRRWLRGVPLSGADARHIHHQLLSVGLTHRRATLVLYVTAVLLACLGVVLAFAPPATVFVIALAGGTTCILLLLYGVRRLHYHEFFEAGAVLVSGAFRVRRMIRDQIQARDLVGSLNQLRTFEQVDTLLRESADQFGFLGLELCREASSCRRSLWTARLPTVRAWKLDHPVMPRGSHDDDPYVLRIWCGEGSSYRPFGAERVARILAPAIERWLMEYGAVESPPEFHPMALGARPALASSPQSNRILRLAPAGEGRVNSRAVPGGRADELSTETGIAAPAVQRSVGLHPKQ
jgi:UDP-GlcNAc:undecaprenyl-phosphate/decaprenyl-phosphate GlcNAc-1-phosphate transferase